MKRIARTAWRTLLRFPRQVCQVCAARGHLELARCASTLPRKTAAEWGRRLASSLPVCLCARVSGYLSIQENRHDTVSEWLRRWTRNPLGSARRGSNPLGVVCAPRMVVREVWPSWKAAWPAEAHKGGTCSVGLALSGKPSTKGKVLSARAARALARRRRASRSVAHVRVRGTRSQQRRKRARKCAQKAAQGLDSAAACFNSFQALLAAVPQCLQAAQLEDFGRSLPNATFEFVKSLHWGLSPGPSVYTTAALPLSYRGAVAEGQRYSNGQHMHLPSPGWAR